MLTRRQEIAAILREGPTTVRELAARLACPLAEIVEHLGHIQRSVGGRLRVGTASCADCGLRLTKRTRFVAPSRCPRCRSERTSEPELSLGE